ncbi:hypothetical protein HMPREF3034_00309 [Prevotella sp. DNF00663]|uniref:hypothetical protein n=1 Tax=unclassified Prevotella TaxID=2638335 RepID=UPI000513CF49|nr:MULTISPECIES: hypothetical protein [unclassified Prevotella]KGI61515.1 hypothetical protein HMPREF0671_00600 [Prevotella sp. S7 MS 2]KXB85128.1 hypothetical protein HMPREF3034_00309 [Prevotella sp. DNF00663]
MATTALQPKRKIIDLSGETFRSLSVMAANRGTNLKNFIEGLLDKVAEEYDENKQYAWLAENVPEGKEMLDEEEQADFEKWLGI